MDATPESTQQLEEVLQRLWDKEDWAMMAEELEAGGEIVDWLREPYKGRGLRVLGAWKARARKMIAEMEKERDQ